MPEATKQAESKPAPKPADTDTRTKEGRTQTVRAGGTTVKVSILEEEKSVEQLEKEAREAAERRMKEEAEGEEAKAKAFVDKAQGELDKAKENLEQVKAGGKAKGPGARTKEGDDLHEEQIRTGQAPLAPGPEKPVSREDAHDAKENRGRGAV